MSLNKTKKRKLCLQCLECCKVFYVPTQINNEAEKEFYELRGCTVENFRGNQVVVIPLPCPHLTPEGCNIYNERPEVCKNYDGTKDPLMKDKCLWIDKNRRKK
jgi:Fe-S-cluster containining protein